MWGGAPTWVRSVESRKGKKGVRVNGSTGGINKVYAQLLHAQAAAAFPSLKLGRTTATPIFIIYYVVYVYLSLVPMYLEFLVWVQVFFVVLWGQTYYLALKITGTAYIRSCQNAVEFHIEDCVVLRAILQMNIRSRLFAYQVITNQGRSHAWI